MFQWFRTKASMIAEIKSLRSRLDIKTVQIRILENKLNKNGLALAALKATRKATPAIPVKKRRDYPIIEVDHIPKAPTYGSSTESSPKHEERNEHGFPFGALVSKE